MAERLGLPTAVVADARSRRDARELQAEALIQNLEEERAAARAGEASARSRSRVPRRSRERVLEAEARGPRTPTNSRRDFFARSSAEEVATRCCAGPMSPFVRRRPAWRPAVVRCRRRRPFPGPLRPARSAALVAEDPRRGGRRGAARDRGDGRARHRRAVGCACAPWASSARWCRLCGADMVEIVVGGKRMRAPRSELVVVAGRRGPTAARRLPRPWRISRRLPGSAAPR